MSTAKSVCSPSSLLMSSLLKVRPGMRPRFLSQKIAQKLPLKWMPSTHANASSRCAKISLLLIHLGPGRADSGVQRGQFRRICRAAAVS
jgi:hypothetical protein